MKRKNHAYSWGFWITLVLCSALLSVTLLGGKYNATPRIPEDEEIIQVVKSFWEFTETGELEKANSLTTNTFKGIRVEVENQEPMEKWLYELNIKHILVEMHKKVDDENCVVRVKVKNGERKYYLFHDLVKNERGEWKIISISN